ncbi:TonB-dependent receptor [Mariniphaga sediminis]|nr:TonB-dependent receptor [Mariniphaga sediminis]
MMKMVWIFVLASALQVTAGNMKSYSQATKLNLRLKNVSLESVIWNIKKQTEFSFFYNSEDIKGVKNIDVDLEDVTVEEILLSVLNETDLTFEIVHKTIIIRKDIRLKSRPVVILEQQPQQKEITGKVTDTGGQPLPGVTIVVKGTTQGTVTNVDGEFSFHIPLEAEILQFSFVGMEMQEVPIGERTTFSIVLEEATIGLEEVVAVGYGIQKKESVVGSISSVTNEDLDRRTGLPNLSSALSGQLPGLTVMEQTGEPGRADPEIFIRGQSTWNSASPLILVDGIERKMNDINVEEIESISILKDASSTAVFGVKGANGVILITTRRGSLGKPKFNISANVSYKMISRLPELLNSYDAKSWKNVAIENELSARDAGWQYYTPVEVLNYSKQPQESPYNYLYPDVDWVDELTKDFAKSHRFNVDVAGGTDFVNYFASLGYMHDGDILNTHYNEAKDYDPGFSYDRLNFRANLDFNLTKTTIFSANVNGYLGNQKSINADFGGVSDPNTGGGPWGHLYRGLFELPPDAFPVKYPSGRYGKYIGNVNMNNPVAIMQEGGVRYYNRRHVGIDLKLEQELNFIAEGLKFNMNVAWDNYVVSSGPNIVDGNNQGQAIYEYQNPEIINATTRQDSLDNIFIFNPTGLGEVNEFDIISIPWRLYGEYVENSTLQRSLFYQAGLNYDKIFGKHSFSGLALFNRREDTRGSSFTNYREDWVGRVAYNYDSKYLVEFNGAYNGSEKFSPEYRFGFFPSAAVGWMVSSEKFMEKYSWLDKLKLRVSVGKVGSDRGIPRWGYIGSWINPGRSTRAFYSPETGAYPYSPYNTYYEGTIPNENLRWETATKKNLGIELLFLQKFSLDIDVFQDDREDIFMTANKRNVPATFGASPVPANLGKTQSKGFEIVLGARNYNHDGWGYNASFFITRARDVVIAMEDPILLDDYLKNEGFQIGQTKTQLSSGALNNWDDIYASARTATNQQYRLPGDWDIVDFNSDGIIDSYDAVPYGFPSRPEYTYTANLGGNYKKLSWMVQFTAVTNVTLYSPYVTPGQTLYTPVSSVLNDYWTPQNTVGATYKAPRLTTTSPNGQFGLYDASYLRLKTAEIAYRLDGRWIRNIGISNVQLTISGNNLLFWSKMPMDRETGNFDIQNAYPIYRQINLGIKLSI